MTFRSGAPLFTGSLGPACGGAEWKKLESYKWLGATEGGSEVTLILYVRTRTPRFRRALVPVPVEQRNRVALLIRDHCPRFAALEQEAVVELEDGTRIPIHGVEMADSSYSSRELLRCDTPTGRKKIPFSEIREIVFSIHWSRTSSCPDHLGARVVLRNGDEIDCMKPSAWHLHGFDRSGFETAIRMRRRGGPGEPGRTAQVSLRFVHYTPSRGESLRPGSPMSRR